MSNSSTENIYSRKTVTIHMALIAVVCVAFGTINLISGSTAVGAITLAMGILVPVVTIAIRNRTEISTQGFILSIVQLLTIIVISTAKHELHTMFALMLASMAVASIYCSIICLATHWAIMDVASVVGVFVKDFFYGEESIVTIIKGILSINIGAVVLIFLIRSCIRFMNATREEKNHSLQLFDEVNSKMDDVNRLMENQKSVVQSVSGITDNLWESVEGLKDVSLEMSSAAEEQQRTMTEITDDISTLAEQTNKSYKAASRARSAADENTNMLTENNSEVDRMLSAMNDISDSSEQIGTIIRAIEDIAFQTNILALNASIEAARAGQAGKGFAVVADEVRNLASKSDEAAKSTSALIHTSIEAVKSGSDIAHNVAAKMKESIEVSKQSAEYSATIAELTETQTDMMNAMRSKMEQVSRSIANGLDISEKNNEIAHAVSDEVEKLNDAIGSR